MKKYDSRLKRISEAIDAMMRKDDSYEDRLGAWFESQVFKVKDPEAILIHEALQAAWLKCPPPELQGKDPEYVFEYLRARSNPSRQEQMDRMQSLRAFQDLIEYRNKYQELTGREI